MRFDGNGFAALAPGASAPFGIAQWVNSTRLIVPLHASPTLQSGSFIVRAFEAGSFEINWELVEVPKSQFNSSDPRDFLGSKAVFRTGQTWRFEITPRTPLLFVQDRFSVEVPSRTSFSLNGEFILKVFSGYYRVFDVKSGALIVERAGWNPNFSPTSKFLAAFGGSRSEIDTSEVEIIDLFSGELIHAIKRPAQDEGEAARDYEFGAIAWGLADSVAVLGYNVFGNIRVIQTLINREADEISSDTCHACSPTKEAVYLDPNNLLVRTAKVEDVASWSDFMLKVYSNNERKSGREISDDLEPWDEWATSSLVLKLPSRGDDRHPLSAGEAEYRKAYETMLQNSSVRLPYPRLAKGANNWVLGASKPFSHSLYRWKAQIVEHPARPVEVLQQVAQNDTDVGGQVIRLRGERSESEVHSVPTGSAQQNGERRFLQRLQEFGISVEAHAAKVTTRAPDDNDTLSASMEFGRAVQGSIEGSFPALSTLFDARNARNVERAGCMETNNKSLAPENVHTYWKWEIGNQQIMVLQTHCTSGSSQDAYGHLILLRGTHESAKAPVWITKLELKGHPLSYYLSTYDASPLIVDVSLNRYLLIASNGRFPSIVIYDLLDDKIVTIIENIRAGYLATKVFLTSDKARIVQLNSDGQFHIYKVSNGSHIVSGYYVDDEIVLYDDRRYFRFDTRRRSSRFFAFSRDIGSLFIPTISADATETRYYSSRPRWKNYWRRT